MVNFDQLKVAIAHYWLIKERGGEKVLKNLLEIFPQADVYTLFYEQKNFEKMLKGHRVFSSYLDHAWLRSHYTKLFPLYPSAVKSLNLADSYDLIISSESGPVKGICKPKNTPHICFTHTPMRYCWGYTNEYTRNFPSLLRSIVSKAFERLKLYDKTTIKNVDTYLANSNNVSERIKMYYQRDSIVVHPPLEDHVLDRSLLKSRPKNDTFLSFGALVPYKRIDLLVDCFNQRKEKLIIVGEGSERIKLEAKANNNIQFMGSLAWHKIAELMETSQALLFPGEEDFGIIPLEAMALGCPVIAYAKGGALETVHWSGRASTSSGLFFKSQTIEAIHEVIKTFHNLEDEFDPNWMRDYTKNFSQSKFKSEIKKQVKAILS